jgi:putative salt-induced outer membrane protein YdiY
MNRPQLGGPRGLIRLVAAATALLCAPALAQPAAIEEHAEASKADLFQADVTALNASLGAAVNTGNTEAWQLNTGSQFDLVRGHHGAGVTMVFAYGRANVPTDALDQMVDTVRNFKTRARYDYFFTPMDSLFVAAGYRWDTFAGLDVRAQAQLGYMRSFFKEEKHRFWGELGYDLTYDNYDPDPLPDPNNAGSFLPGDDVVHSVRLFAGYDNQLNEQVTFLTGLEALINVEDTSDVRLAWDNALRSSIGNGFQLELKFTLGLDTLPVPGTKKVDTATVVNLIYTLL